MKEAPERVWLYEIPGQSLRMSRSKPPGDSTEYRKVEGPPATRAKPGPKPRKVEVATRVMPKALNREAKPRVTKGKV